MSLDHSLCIFIFLHPYAVKYTRQKADMHAFVLWLISIQMQMVSARSIVDILFQSLFLGYE